MNFDYLFHSIDFFVKIISLTQFKTNKWQENKKLFCNHVFILDKLSTWSEVLTMI